MRKLLAFLVLVAVVGAGAVAGAQVSQRFSDVPEGHYAEVPIAWAVDNEITTGTSKTTFSPDDTLTRAQMVTFLKRYHDNVAEVGYTSYDNLVIDLLTDAVDERVAELEARIAQLEAAPEAPAPVDYQPQIDALASCVRGVWLDSSESDEMGLTLVGYVRGIYTEAEWQTALADQRTVRDEARARCAGVLP